MKYLLITLLMLTGCSTVQAVEYEKIGNKVYKVIPETSREVDDTYLEILQIALEVEQDQLAYSQAEIARIEAEISDYNKVAK